MIIGSLLFLLLCILTGFTVLRSLSRRLTTTEQIVWGIPIGLALVPFVTFLLAVILPHQDWAIALSCLLAATFILHQLNNDSFRHQLVADIQTGWQQLTPSDWLTWSIVVLPWFLYCLFTVPLLLSYQNGDLVAGWINVWGDWAVHLRSSTFFAAHDRLTLESPIYSGTRFHYPYLASYLSAILQRLNLDPAASLTWPTFLLLGSLPAQLYLLGQRFTNNRIASVLIPYLFLLSGGGGLIHLITDLFNGRYFWQTDAYHHIVYTDWGRINGLATNDGIWFMNFIMSEFIPQRAFLAGIGIALFVLRTAWLGLNQPTVNRRDLLLAGLLFGLLPIIHTHSFIALGLIIPLVWLYRHITNRDSFRQQLPALFSLLIPATIVGFTLFLLFVFDVSGTGSFIHAIPWWVPNPEDPVNPIRYWLWNAGPVIILGLLSAIWLKQYRSLLLIGGLLWLICNKFSFQPWQYDNLKILTYWYLLWIIPIACLLTTLPKRLWLLAIPAVIALTGAGLADTLAVTVSAHSGGLRLADQAGVVAAQQVKRHTTQEAMILAATNHDHPLSLLSGRQLYMGYEGWLWTYGINWSPRFDEIKEMYAATPTGLMLIEERQIDFIIIGPQEKNRFTVNESALRSLYPTVFDSNGYALLRVE